MNTASKGFALCGAKLFVLEQKGVYARSVQTIAEEMAIPDWLVDVRHDATHSSLPSLEVLETGCHIALAWLKTNYWDQTLQCINAGKTSFCIDEFNEMLDQYVMDYWPKKEVDKAFFESYNTILSKKISSSYNLRYD